jgi:hypothetical protein
LAVFVTRDREGYEKFDSAKRHITVRMGHNRWYQNQLCPRKVIALTEEGSLATRRKP